jgi:hypothetical protein
MESFKGRSVPILAFIAIVVFSQMASAQSVATCAGTNSLAVGTYGFILSAGTFQPITANPPGTTGATVFQPLAVTPPGTSMNSNTELGRLLTGVGGTTAGSVTGLLYFDGNGSIFASATIGGSPNTIVGTYVVYSDCTIAVSLNDLFALQPPAKPVSFTGFLASTGSEIDLVPSTQLPASPRSLIQLMRVNPQTSCSASTLFGPYALTGSGFLSSSAATNTSGNAANFPFFARLRFDGNGNIVAEPTTGTSTSPLATFQYTGTYTVNSDCTGTLTISQAPASTTTPPATGTTAKPTVFTAAFLITGPIVQVNSAGVVAFQNTFQLRPSFVFSFANQDQFVSGIGKAQ